MKTEKARKTGKIRAAAAVTAVCLLAGSICRVYGAEPENPAQIIEESRAAGADETPETPADVQIQNPAEQPEAPVSAPDGTLPEFSDSPPVPDNAEKRNSEEAKKQDKLSVPPADTEIPSVDFTSGEPVRTPGQSGNQGQESQLPQQAVPEFQSPQKNPEEKPETPAQEDEKTQSGTLYITREKLEKGIRANKDFRITVLLKNTWTSGNIRGGRMNLELPQELSLHSSYKKETFDLPAIQPGATEKINVRLRAGEIKEDGRTLRLKVKTVFQHEPEGKETEQQEVLLIPVNASDSKAVFVDNTASYGSVGGEIYAGGAESAAEEKKKTDPMIPRIIVSQYDYDKDAVAGKTFQANITICNTNEKLTVENMVVSMETGETASLQGSSNMVYVKRLKPQETYRTGIQLKTLEDGKTDSADITLNFKYEYIKNEERTEVESSQKISVPVQTPDRFSAGELQTADEPTVGEEFTVSLPYVNKGKISVSNVEAVIKTEMKAGETYKYLGNVEAGTSGTLDFFVTPEEAGEQKVQITLTYENSAGQEKTVKKEKVFHIAEGEFEADEELFGEDMMTGAEGQTGMDSGSKVKTGVLAAGGGGIAAALAAGVSRMKKRKRRMEEEDF